MALQQQPSPALLQGNAVAKPRSGMLRSSSGRISNGSSSGRISNGSSSSSSSAALLSLGAAASGVPRITMRVASKGAYICRDCGYIYSDRTPFAKLPDKYSCPVCGAPKRRFKPYEDPVSKNANDTKVRKARKAELQSSGNGAALPIGIAIGLVALVGTYLYLNSMF